jgi:uncharacterized membrane protein YdbT with pleckstrin-like domain
MRYIDKSLAPGEEVVVRGQWPTFYWIGAWLALIVLGIILVGVFIFIGAAIKMNTTDFAVTNRRVILKRGWLNLSTQEVSTNSIETVEVAQTFWGRVFGFGRVRVTGTGDSHIVFPPMKNPIAFRRAIESARAHVSEVHLAERDREALAEAAHPANEVEEVEEERAPRRARRRGFIGLLSH